MPSWGDFKALEPEMAALVERLFGVRRHKTIATIRKDGSPRISGIECSFDQGQLSFGSMLQSRKLADLLRNPRFALHSPTTDPVEGSESAWKGEAKISGRAVPNGVIEGEGAPEGELFVADIFEVVHMHLDETATKLVVEWWTPSDGLHRVERT